MTDAPNPEKPAEADRIAKVIARAGLASRREAERMVIEGRVTVNGEKIASPALDVMPTDKIKVDGKPLDEPQETRLWMYYKPVGLVTSESDEKGRQTVFDALPRDLPRVMSIGRLDLNSEGLLLLTNDGELKRRLELPATGWLRRYRVRVNGNPTDLTFDPLRRGVTIEDEDFQPMEVRLDSQQGANAWLTVGIREGRNREIRRAMSHVGMQVNRLIRIGYGPFKLTGMEENEVREVKRRTLRDQLGGLLTGEVDEKPRDFRERGAERDGPRRREDGDRKPRFDRGDGASGGRKPFGRRDDDGPSRPVSDRGDGPRKPRFDRAEGGGRPFRARDDEGGPRKPRFDKADGPAAGRKPYGRRDEDGPARPVRDRDDAPRKPRWSSKPGGSRDGEGDARREGGKPYERREGGKPYARREGGKPYERREGGKPYERREGGKPYGSRDGGKPGERREGGKPFARRDGDKPFARRDSGEASGGRDGGKSFAKRDGGKPFGARDSGKSFGSRDGAKPGPRRDGGKPGGFAGRDGGGKSFGPRKDGGRPGPKGKAGPGRGPKPGGPRPGGGKPRAPRG